MKILYAIQGTGNGHISRAMDVGPALEKFGEVDYLLSGAQVEVNFNKEIKYRSQGLSFYFGKSGGINYTKTLHKNASLKLYNEIKAFPLEQYDLIFNDFEPITAWAAKRKGLKCIGLSHQGALLSNKCPKPDSEDVISSLILKKYAPASVNYGFHFSAFDDNIYTPVVRQAIRNLQVADKGHYTVYLPAYADEKIIKVLTQIKGVRWQVFSKHASSAYEVDNVSISVINNDKFITSMASATGVLCGAGFETPAEALFLGKKLMVIPMKGQYEQHCNAAALKTMGVPVIKKLKKKKIDKIKDWIETEMEVGVDYPDETEEVVKKIIEKES